MPLLFALVLALKLSSLAHAETEILFQKTDTQGQVTALLEKRTRKGQAPSFRWLTEDRAQGNETNRVETLWSESGPLQLTESQEAPGKAIHVIYTNPDPSLPKQPKAPQQKHADSSFFLHKLQIENSGPGHIKKIEWSRPSTQSPWKKISEKIEKRPLKEESAPSVSESGTELLQQCKDPSTLCPEDLKKFERPCGEGTAQSVFKTRPELFCGGRQDTQASINPYAVARSAPGSLSDSCKSYLLTRAAVEAQSYLQKAPQLKLTLAQKKILRGARDAFQFIPGPACAAVLHSGTQNSMESLGDAVTQISQVISLNRTIPNRDPQKTDALYCSVFETACTQMGGTLTEVPLSKNGHQLVSSGSGGPATLRTCSVGNLVINPSCTTPENFEKISQAVKDLTTRSSACLSKLSPQAGAQLQRMLKDPQSPKRTELCCGRCENSPYPYLPPPDTPNPDTLGYTYEDPYAPLVMTRAAFSPERTQEEFNDTLFHEMLHRTGMCTDEKHNHASVTNPSLSDWYSPLPANGQCPPGTQAQNLCPNWVTDLVSDPKQKPSCSETMGALQLMGITGKQCTSRLTPVSRNAAAMIQTLESSACSPFAALIDRDAMETADENWNPKVCVKTGGGDTPTARGTFAPHSTLLDPVYACASACSATGEKNRKTGAQKLLNKNRAYIYPAAAPSSPEELIQFTDDIKATEKAMQNLRALESAKVCAEFAAEDSTWSGRSIQEAQGGR